jgi:hypothetical protein
MLQVSVDLEFFLMQGLNKLQLTMIVFCVFGSIIEVGALLKKQAVIGRFSQYGGKARQEKAVHCTLFLRNKSNSYVDSSFQLSVIQKVKYSFL